MNPSHYRDLYEQNCFNPFDILGLHRDSIRHTITVYRPGIKNVKISAGSSTKDAYQDADGVFSAEFEEEPESHYHVIYKGEDGMDHDEIDPYSFPPELSSYDIYLYREGNLQYAYRTFGSHFHSRDGIEGTRFVVWAPNARSVSVVGDFNMWDIRKFPMQNVNGSGIWEIFIPGVGYGAFYKFALKTPDGEIEYKSDPFAFRMEKRPRTASIVSDLSHAWSDSHWIQKREDVQSIRSPISIYEMHLGSWKRPQDGRDFFTIREIGPQIIEYVKKMGFTHIEIMPLMEHPLDESWGYQVVNYFAPTSRYGEPSDYMWFIQECHRNDIGVILDWVPAHFPADEYGLYNFDGTHLYEHADPRKGLHPDWGTRIFNLSRFEVKNYLISNAIFWVDMYHADGIRIDAVSSMLYLDYSRKEGEWIPNEYGGRENLDSIAFLRGLNDTLHESFPGVITIAEESTAWPSVTRDTRTGGLGFDFKWNMGWMHDTLDYFSHDPIYRKYQHNILTFTIWYAFSESFILPLSHDEVVHLKGSLYTKMPGDNWQKLANLRSLLAFMFLSPGKKLLFMGSEFGQHEEWNVTSGLNWDTASSDDGSRISQLVGDLNSLYRRSGMSVMDSESRGFEWIDFSDSASSIISFYRHTLKGSDYVAVFNLTPVPRSGYRIGVHSPGKYNEIMNTDASIYGGSNMGNYGGVIAEDAPYHGKERSIVVTIPPLACVVFETGSDR
ncbi:MAG: 1,4-alpha-glucan branching protein GlgB [Candidatus Thermoplasmatota archaeon]|nr:1,4-alpha-glucan branching protein GlgB [Candidatus Thermoplasmatota archaeon]